MYATSSAIVWDTYPEPENSEIEPIKIKKKKRRNKVVAKESNLITFSDYYDSNINEVVDPSKVVSSSDDSVPIIFYEDNSFRVKEPENGQYFDINEIKKLIGAKNTKSVVINNEYILVYDADSDSKMVNVKGTIILNSVNNTGELVGGTCIMVPISMLPQ